MAQWDLWSGLKIRLMSAAGVQLYVWYPSTDVHMIQLEPTYGREEESREAAGYRVPSFRGYRAHLKIVMETLAGHFAGSGIASSLETVLNGELANAGSYFEVALHATIGNINPDWKRCNLLPPGYEPETLGACGGLRLTLEFEGAAIQQTAPARDNGGTW